MALGAGSIMPASAQEPPPTYTVLPGDNLTRIAQQHAVTVAAIAAENSIANPDRIYAGQVLRLPVAREGGGAAFAHVVVPRETLFAIAHRYGTTVTEIASANRLGNPNLIFAGQQLLIPAGQQATVTEVVPGEGVPPASGQLCEGPWWTVRYPAGWHTNSIADTDASDACRWFNREPFDVALGAETFTDVMFAVVGLTVDESIARLVEADFARVTAMRETVVAGRRAVVVESVRTRDLVYPEGTRSYRYLVDLGTEALEVVTYGTAGRDYAGNRAVLEEMVATLELR